nr:TIGR00645 family protein [Streptomyces sp. NRRL S-146]
MQNPTTTTLGYALFATRWLQAPLYFGLVAAQGVYVYKFFKELWTLILMCVSGHATETYVMLAVLKLVDVVMIANLLIMVIVGGYETFVSRIGLQGHRDQPEWLSHVNSNVLKVKLATAIVGISSVHLLQMFVDVHHTSHHALLWGTVIHMAFIASAAILAYMSGPMVAHTDRAHVDRSPAAPAPVSRPQEHERGDRQQEKPDPEAPSATPALHAELTALDDHPLLIVDEVGYTPLDPATAGLFFQLVAHRYERASLIVTSDRPLGRWDEVFGPSAPALTDRLAHHADVVRLDGDSYRTRHATSAWAD